MLTRVASFTLLSLGLAAGLSAQAATYTFFGAGCAAVPVPLVVTGVPRIGGTFSIETEGTVFSQFSIRQSILVTGISNTQAGPVPLPFDLSVLSSPLFQFCGQLLSSTEIVVPVPPSGVLSFTVPNSPSLLGTVLYQQVLQTDRVRLSGVTFIRTSRGGRGMIGT